MCATGRPRGEHAAHLLPQPGTGGVAPRSGAREGLCAVHHRRHHRRAADRRPALGGPWRPARRRLRRGRVGGAVRAGWRQALSPGHRLADLLGPRRGRDHRGAAHLGRRAGYLGRGRSRSGRRVDRLPSPWDPAARVRRRRRAGSRPGAGHRPARKLLQPGALRQGNDAAVGAGDLLPARPVGIRRPAFPRGHLDRADRLRRAADVPLRIDLGRLRFHRADSRGPSLYPGARTAVRPLCRRVLHRAVRGRVAAR